MQSLQGLGSGGGLEKPLRACDPCFCEFLDVYLLDLNSESIRCCRDPTAVCAGQGQPVGTVRMLLVGQGPIRGQAQAVRGQGIECGTRQGCVPDPERDVGGSITVVL